MYSAAINAYFSWCVHLLQDMSAWMGISYQELNVWVFVVIHPLITLLLAYWIIRLRRQLKGPKGNRRKTPEVIRLEPPAIQMPKTMSCIDGDKPPQEKPSIRETAHSEGQSKSKSKNSGMSIMEINDLLYMEDREEKVRLWKASLENFKADMEKWQRGEKPLYNFRSTDELKTAMGHLQSSIDRFEKLNRPE